jgi:hypothetical protein
MTKGESTRTSCAQWCQKSRSLRKRNAFYQEYSAYLSGSERADERTRTADLIMASVRSEVAGRCTGLRISHKWVVFCSFDCSVSHGDAAGLGSKQDQIMSRIHGLRVAAFCSSNCARSTADYRNICGVPGPRRVPAERPPARPARRADRRNLPPQAAPRPWWLPRSRQIVQRRRARSR